MLLIQQYSVVFSHISMGEVPKKKEGGVKAHVLYEIKAQVPAFYTVTTASKHGSAAICSIHYEPNAYIFDRAYDSFKEL